jgi:hypothetical protein
LLTTGPELLLRWSPTTASKKKVLHSWLGPCAEGVVIRDHDLHALSLEVRKVCVLAGFPLGIHPVTGLAAFPMFSSQPLIHQSPPINIKDLSGDEGSGVRGKEKNRLGHILGLSEPSQRNGGDDFLPSFFRPLRAHLRFNGMG